MQRPDPTRGTAADRLACWPHRPPGGRPLVVAHRGGAGEAAENTLAAFAQAAAAGADAIELDVCAARDGELLVTHDESVAAHAAAAVRRRHPDVAALEEVLAWLAAEAPALGVHVDVKPAGREPEIVAALARHGLLARALVSSTSAASLRAFAEVAPALPRAVGYPVDRHGASGHSVLAPAVDVALVAMRLALPLRCARLAAAAAATAVALERRVVSAAAVRRCHASGLAVYVWTVDDPTEALELAALGVDAVVTDVPRLLAGTLTA